MQPSEVNPARVVAAFKKNKGWAYKAGNVELAWTHVARRFGIPVAEVKRMVYEAKHKGPTDE